VVWVFALAPAVDAWFPPDIQRSLVAGGLYRAFEGDKALLERLGWGSHKSEALLTDEPRIRGANVTHIVPSLGIPVI
jgi:hypothetical protein